MVSNFLEEGAIGPVFLRVPHEFKATIQLKTKIGSSRKSDVFDNRFCERNPISSNCSVALRKAERSVSIVINYNDSLKLSF